MIALVVALPPLAAVAGADGTVAGLPAERLAELDHLLRQDCGSCHGMTMKGGLGPALLPATLQDRDDDGLVMTILDGIPERAMPPWRGQLTEAEAMYLVHRLKQGTLQQGERR